MNIEGFILTKFCVLACLQKSNKTKTNYYRELGVKTMIWSTATRKRQNRILTFYLLRRLTNYLMKGNTKASFIIWKMAITWFRFSLLCGQAPPSPTFLKSILSLKSRFWPQIPHLILKSPSPHKFEDSSRYNFEEILKYLRVNKNIP